MGTRESSCVARSPLHPAIPRPRPTTASHGLLQYSCFIALALASLQRGSPGRAARGASLFVDRGRARGRGGRASRPVAMPAVYPTLTLGMVVGVQGGRRQPSSRVGLRGGPGRRVSRAAPWAGGGGDSGLVEAGTLGRGGRSRELQPPPRRAVRGCERRGRPRGPEAKRVRSPGIRGDPSARRAGWLAVAASRPDRSPSVVRVLSSSAFAVAARGGA